MRCVRATILAMDSYVSYIEHTYIEPGIHDAGAQPPGFADIYGLQVAIKFYERASWVRRLFRTR